MKDRERRTGAPADIDLLALQLYVVSGQAEAPEALQPMQVALLEPSAAAEAETVEV
jgi:hypothetical protein